jgi:beta-phosphoglucomutase
MLKLGVSPHETLIVEDNEHGLQAARASGAHVLVVRDVGDVNLGNIDRRIDTALRVAA